MTRILLVYATHFGQTRKIAETIARHLRRHEFSVEVHDVASAHPPSPAGYDLVVIGSRIELGHHATSLRAYVKEHVTTLRSVPTGFFVVCNAAARPNAGSDPDGYGQAFFDEMQWHPTVSASFAGALRYRSYGWFLRFIMKRIAKNAGHPTDTSRDHELTDWDAVIDFADALADLFPQHDVATHSYTPR